MSNIGLRQRLVKGALGGWVYGTSHYRSARYTKRGDLVAMVCVKIPRESIEKYKAEPPSASNGKAVRK